MKTNELLRRYVADRSETAFADLVRQNIALVYSAALRQVNGDGPAAEDVAQAVFTDLARKAPGLTNHPSLTGWLYTSTRYLASKVCRAEQSRRSREQKAHAMNQLLQTPDPDTIWQDLRPLLDDAMHDLSASDREAVLLRYFERLPLAEIGARLGLTDKAAHMRIERAIDRLRAALAKRGVTSTVAALALVLTERAIGAVPAGLSARISRAAVATVAAGGALGWGLLRLAALIKAQALPAAVAVALVVAVIFAHFGWNKDQGTTSPIRATTTASANGNSNAVNPLTALLNGNRVHPASVPDTASNMMILHIVADDTGEPIPAAAIYSPARTIGLLMQQTAAFSELMGRPGPGARASTLPQVKLATADELGTCRIPITPGMPGGLRFFSSTEGFVDELVLWNPNLGNRMPSEYTLRLQRAASIGGTVVDEDGKPIAGAAIEFGDLTRVEQNENDPEAPSSINYIVGYSTPDGSTMPVTDAAGRWHIARFAAEDINERLMFRAHHTNYIREPLYLISIWGGPDGVEKLLAGNYTNTLKRGLSVAGMVVDMNGHPVAGAIVRAESRFMPLDRPRPLPTTPRRGSPGMGLGVLPPLPAITTNQADGTFIITGCRPGTNQIRVGARGYAVTNLAVNLASDTAPLRVVLPPGYVLRLRMVGVNGEPLVRPLSVAGSRVRVYSSQGAFLQPLNADADGRVVWETAPERELLIDVQAPGIAPLTNLLLQANGEEHLITLLPAESSSSDTNR
jgi:RNA polymerase sigma factor (sigma-70 family)